VKSWEKTQETLALLKVLALGNRQVEAGQVSSAKDTISKIRDKFKKP
jgi:hypothetical protein